MNNYIILNGYIIASSLPVLTTQEKSCSILAADKSVQASTYNQWKLKQQSNISSTIHLGHLLDSRAEQKIKPETPQKNGTLHFDQTPSKRRDHKYLSKAIVTLSATYKK